MICVGISKRSVASSLSRSLLYFALRILFLLFVIPLLRLYPVQRPGLGEVISRIRRDNEPSCSVLPLFYCAYFLVQKKNIHKSISPKFPHCHKKRVPKIWNSVKERGKRDKEKRVTNMKREWQLLLQRNPPIYLENCLPVGVNLGWDQTLGFCLLWDADQKSQ